MKPGIHPDYHPVVIQDAATGKMFLTRSTVTSETFIEWPAGDVFGEKAGNRYPLVVVDVTSDSHPLWTGTQRVVDTAGRVQKFERKYGRRTRPTHRT